MFLFWIRGEGLDITVSCFSWCQVTCGMPHGLDGPLTL